MHLSNYLPLTFLLYLDSLVSRVLVNKTTARQRHLSPSFSPSKLVVYLCSFSCVPRNSDLSQTSLIPEVWNQVLGLPGVVRHNIE